MALESGEGSASRPDRSLHPGKTRYPLYRRLDGPQGRSGQVRKISPPSKFDPRTVQPVVSRYSDYATHPLYFTFIPIGKRVSNYMNFVICEVFNNASLAYNATAVYQYSEIPFEHHRGQVQHSHLRWCCRFRRLHKNGT